MEGGGMREINYLMGRISKEGKGNDGEGGKTRRGGRAKREGKVNEEGRVGK